MTIIPGMNLDKVFKQIDEEIARLQTVRSLLEQNVGKNGKPAKRPKRHISEAGRQRIALAMKKRWKAAKKNNQNSLA